MFNGFYGRPPIGYAGYGGPGMFGWFGEVPPCPPLKVPNETAPYCRPRNQLCAIILRAIGLARRAADRLDPSPPAMPTPATQALFQQVFGQPIGTPWPVPGQPSQTMSAGKMVAQRFRVVANELQNRDTIYRCVTDDKCASVKSGGACYIDENPNRLRGLGQFHHVEREPRPELQPLPEPPRPACHPTDTIVVDKVAMALLCRNEVWLCPPFWTMKPLWQDGTLIHEMFHLCFGVTCAWFQHDSRERKRNSAYCYEVFAVGGPAVADPVSVSECSKVRV